MSICYFFHHFHLWSWLHCTKQVVNKYSNSVSTNWIVPCRPNSQKTDLSFRHYNKSLQQGIVPQAWKQSHITPVHKGGSFDEASNFRPISVVSVVAKILEKIVSTQLSSYLENHNLLHHYWAPTAMAKVLKTSCWLQLILSFTIWIRGNLFGIRFSWPLYFVKWVAKIANVYCCIEVVSKLPD